MDEVILRLVVTDLSNGNEYVQFRESAANGLPLNCWTIDINRAHRFSTLQEAEANKPLNWQNLDNTFKYTYFIEISSDVVTTI